LPDSMPLGTLEAISSRRSQLRSLVPRSLRETPLRLCIKVKNKTEIPLISPALLITLYVIEFLLIIVFIGYSLTYGSSYAWTGGTPNEIVTVFFTVISYALLWPLHVFESNISEPLTLSWLALLPISISCGFSIFLRLAEKFTPSPWK
jgi:hypothetical protein